MSLESQADENETAARLSGRMKNSRDVEAWCYDLRFLSGRVNVSRQLAIQQHTAMPSRAQQQHAAPHEVRADELVKAEFSARRSEDTMIEVE